MRFCAASLIALANVTSKANKYVAACYWDCAKEREERERMRETDRQTDKERGERERETHTDKQTDRQRQNEKGGGGGGIYDS